MIVYLIALVFIFSLLIFTHQKDNLKNLGLFVSFVILWAIAGLRDITVGLDTEAYIDFFDSVKNGSIDVLSQVSLWNLFSVEGLENGYKLYNYVLSLFVDSYTPFLMITYAFIFYSFYVFIKRHSPNYLVSMAIYVSLFYFSSMNQLRQAFAAAVLAWGLRYIFERNFKKYLFVVLLATLIHQVSILLIIPYFLYNKKFSSRTVTWYSIVTVALFAIAGQLVQFIASGNIRYETYIDKVGIFELGNMITTTVYAGLAAVAMYFTRSSVFPKKTKSAEKAEVMQRRSFYIKMLLIATLISFISIRISSLNRLALFFMMFSIVAIPYLLSKSSAKRLNSVILVICVLLLMYRFATLILKPEWLGVSDYHMTPGL